MDVATALSDQGIRLRDYDVGEHKVTCPRCSAQRKKKHEPCLNVRLGEDGGAILRALDDVGGGHAALHRRLKFCSAHTRTGKGSVGLPQRP